MTVGQPRRSGRTRRAWRALAVLSLSVLCVVVLPHPDALRAQDPQPPSAPPPPADPPPDAAQEQRPTFRLEANYVRVDAYPTADGKPVPGLSADDFEVLEDGKPQQVEQFERVELRGLTARDERIDPNSVAQGVEQAGDPRRRVFVIYLDTHHTTYAGSHAARKPLVNMLERLIGPDDLFAVVTPGMAGRDIVFARRTELLDQALYSNWTWGQRDAWFRSDPLEQQLEACFPDLSGRSLSSPAGPPAASASTGFPGTAAQLIRRKREEEVIASLESLIDYLGVVREERKAVIMVTQGWQLYRPKPELVPVREDQSTPGPGGIGTGPDGRITTNRATAGTGNLGVMSPIECAQRAVQYANLDNFQRFTLMMQRANRFNVSFYPFDTRGLAATDTQMGDRDERIANDPGEWPNNRLPAEQRAVRNSLPMMLDQEVLTKRLDSLRMIAENTDGLAVINTNDLDAGAQRIVDDLSTYYLLGYYSSNRDLDGKWRKISVRVKKPGVEVRARRGYRALRREDMLLASPDAASEAAGGAGDAAAMAESSAVEAAVGTLAAARDGLPMYSRASWYFGEPADGAPRSGRVWVAAEVAASAMRDPAWKAGATLTATIATADGATLAEVAAPLDPRTRTAHLDAPIEGAAPGSELVVRLRLAGGDGTLPLSDLVRVRVDAGDAGAGIGEPRLLRWGPSTGRVFVPAADPRFRRSERVRVEVPVPDAATAVAAELLDRTGAVLGAIPVKATLLPADADGRRWAQADLTLAPLSTGDYVLRTTITHGGATSRALTGVRVVQ